MNFLCISCYILVIIFNQSCFLQGYFLNPHFQFGLEHGEDVAKETFDETTKVILSLEHNIDIQIKAINQVSCIFNVL